MTIHMNLAALLRDWVDRHGIRGPTATLGVQSASFTEGEWDRVSNVAEDPSRDRVPMTTAGLFGSLGLGPPVSIDVSDYEGADIVFDLSSAALSLELKDRFGFVLNRGSLERAFHVPNALANITRMLREGGVVAHVLPMNNWVSGGFYQFGPKLMYDYYATSGFDLLESAVVAYRPRRNDGAAWEVMAAPPGLFGGEREGSLDDQAYMHIFVARRGHEVNDDDVPIQSLAAPRTARRVAPARWFSTFEMHYGVRVERRNRSITPLTDFVSDTGFCWVCRVPALEQWADGPDDAVRSTLVVLEDDRPLGPAHSAHDDVRKNGSGAYSHWLDGVFLSTPDGSDPNRNGRSYVAVLPGVSSWR